MSDLVHRLSNPPKPHGVSCPVAVVVDNAPTDDAKALQDALAKVTEALIAKSGYRNGYTAKWLADVLKGEGYVVNERAIRRHIHKDCSCES